MKTSRVARLPICAIVVLAAALYAPSAFADATIDNPAGPLTSIGITSDLNCSVNHTGDSAGEFFGGTACGTLVASGGTLYGPASIPAGGSASPLTAYTPVSQTGPTGTGASNDPYTIVTVVDLGSSGLRLTETDTYVTGEESYRTDVTLHNSGGSSASAIIYRAGDCYLAGSDTGYGAHDLTSGSVTCVEAVDNGSGGTMPGTRIESWLPLTGGSHSYEAGFDDVWAKIGTQAQFDDTCLCDQNIDNGAGLSWAVSVPGGGSVTRSNLITFSPTGHLPLSTSKTADSGAAAPGTSDGYTITISNPNTSAVSLDTITDTLPSGFTYTSGSSTGATTSNPNVNGQVLTWSGPINVPAASGGTAGTTTLHFNVTVSSTAGDYFNNAGGTATNYTIVGTGDTAEVIVGTIRQLSVTKDGSGSGTVTSSPSGVNCGGTCSANFIDGTVVTLTAAPATGSTFTGWSGEGCSGTGTCQVTMSQARSVTATFTALRTLTVSKSGNGTGGVSSSPTGIDCGATCTHDYSDGTVVTLTATAATGSAFTGWSGEGCSGTGTCQVTMSQARSVTATFTLQTRTLTVNKGGTGSGSVSSSPAGVNCGSTCSSSYDYGTVVTLTATPAAGSTFTGWSGDCSGTGTCQLTMTGDHTVTASFALQTHTLTVNKSGSGSGGVASSPAGIDCGATCSTSYSDGSIVTLTPTPAAGSAFTGWSGDCSGTGPCQLTMTGDHTVTATFDAPLAPPVVGTGGLFCGAQHRGKCNGIPVKGIFDRPGNASWSFDAFNPTPGNSATAAGAKKVHLGQVNRVIKKAGTVTFVFKLKPGAKTNKLYKQVKKLKLRYLVVTLRFTDSAGHTSVKTTAVKLKL